MAPPARPPTPAPTSARWRRSTALSPLSRPAAAPMAAPISAPRPVRLGSSGALVWPVYVAQLASSRLPASAVAMAALVEARMGVSPRRSGVVGGHDRIAPFPGHER